MHNILSSGSVSMLKKVGIGLLVMTMALLPVMPFASGKVAAITDPTNLIANPSMEISTNGTDPDGWVASSWGSNYTPAPDSDTPPTTYVNEDRTGTGTRSLKTTITSYDTTVSADQQGDSKWIFTPLVITPDTTSPYGHWYVYTHWYKSDVQTEIDVIVTHSNGTETYDNLLTVPASPDIWTQLPKITYLAPADATSITFAQPLDKVGFVQIDDAELHSYAPDPLNQAMVSITFDDGWLDQYTYAREKLNAHNMKATFYTLSGILDGSYIGYMNADHLVTLQSEGHEIGGHTITHPSLPTLTPETLDNELLASKQALQGLLGINAAVNFATPYGDYDAASLDKIKQYYGSHRSVEEGYNGLDFDKYDIKVKNILDATTPQDVADWINQAIHDKTWLVLVYHRVTPTEPMEEATDTTDTEHYWTTPEYLNQELDYIASSGIAVKTVAQALTAIKEQQTTPTPPVAPNGYDQYPGDADGDKKVGLSDLQIVSVHWGMQSGATRQQGDLEGNDGDVDIYDLQVLSNNWGKQYE